MTRILIAEDDSEINNLMALSLRMEHYEVLQAFDGRQALEMVHSHSPDIMLLDVMMPFKTGYEVAGELRDNPATASMPIIFVTARQDMQDRVAGLDLAVDYVCKPFAVPELLARVRSAVRVRKLQEQLAYLAVTDELTGLTNRRGFLTQFEDELWRARRYGHPLALVLFDLDHFKKVNDTYGHAKGDEVLTEFARVLEKTSRRVDVTARFGGEEFAAVLPETDLEGAQAFAEKVRLATQGIGDFGLGQPVHITVSAGAVSLPHVHLDSDSHTSASDAAAVIRTLLEEADRCLYRAKDEGRDRVVALSINGSPAQ